MNPILDKFQTPFGTVPFDKIKEEHYLPALEEAMKEGRKAIQAIVENTEKPTFSNVCEALEKADPKVGTVASIFFNLYSAESNDELQKIAQEFSPKITTYSDDIYLNPELFEKVKYVYDERDKLNLKAEEATLVENQYRNFVKSGALLSNEEKEKVRGLSKSLSQLTLNFGDNLLKASNAYQMHLTDEKDVDGLPDGAKEAARELAQDRDLSGWVVTLDYPSYIPFMTYATNRDLRETLYRANSSKCFNGGEFDNQKIIKEIVAARYEKANLLGFKNHAELTLSDRMAQSPEKVFSFLEDLKDKAIKVAQEEVEELKVFARELDHIEDFAMWDYAYYAEKLKKERFNISDEMLKPYFQIEKCVEGVFEVAQKLYGITFKERKDIPTYHEDVSAFEVVDENNKHVGVFYADFFPRAGKKNGAWMTSYREQEGENRPHVSIVCNFTKPTESKPSLLNFGELLTLFHEFGHSLHGLLSECKYKSLGGTNVYWDFVELPSQILENWCFEKKCLDLFATHYETNEPIPAELVQKIKESSTFHEGRATMRQIGFSTVDMAWHTADPATIEDVGEFERKAMEKTNLIPVPKESNQSCHFGHIFQGGYSAGYYSYKWAEVLDADAFEFFKEKGIFNKEVASLFKANILSKGGSEHPATLYRRFRGKDPSVDALLKRAGLLK